jgi:Integrase core domain
MQKDASTVPAEPEGKQQHVVETLNIIDTATSVLIASHVRCDFTAETALQALAQTFAEHGLPHSMTLDRDTRWVGARPRSAFPAAFIRFCHSLGVAVVVCAPHHPAQNGCVERYNRTYQEECLWVYRPTTLSQVREVTSAFVEHYNWQRPHQGIACGNRPPRTAFPELPSLPRVPDVVNADAWLAWVDGEHVVRLVNQQGCVKVDLRSYYIASKLVGQPVTLRMQAAEGCLQVVHPPGNPRSLPRVWPASTELRLSSLCGAHGAGGFHATTPACLTAAAQPLDRCLFSLTRCRYTDPPTKLVHHTRMIQVANTPSILDSATGI